ncbi:MAG: C25 family cysteine peptidase [Bacteroidales bacterium]|nr:C25 family cysteine peptidase [Bacteroidales bacterium]
MVLSYRSGSYGFSEIRREEHGFVRLMLADHSHTSSPGKPELPIMTRLIDYDRAGNARIIISNVISIRKSLGDMAGFEKLYPSQPAATKNQDPQDIPFVIDKKIYNSDRPYIRDTVTIERIGTMRGKSIGRLEINPVIYHPGKKYLDIIISMDIRIEYSKPYIPAGQDKGSYSYTFDQLISKGLINYDSDDVVPGFSLAAAGMVIVSDISMKKHLRPLVEWKTRKGFRVTELYIGENGLEKSFSDIKDSLRYIWDNATAESPAPTYLILAGDLNLIPESEGTAYLTDMYYAEFDGEDDFIPDMFTGRLPAKDSSQMKAIVHKIIEYESFLFGDSITHFKKAMAFTGLDRGWVTYMDGQVNYAGHYFDINPYETEAYVFNHESNDSIRNVRYDSLRTMMKEGVGFINYTGHGTATKWEDTGIDYSFAGNMDNISRYPVIISNACLTANYSNENCLGSSMVRAVDRGALAFIGCSNDSYWDEDYYWAVGAGTVVSQPDYNETGLGFYDRLFHLNGEAPSDWYTTMGQIMFAGNMAVSSSSSSHKQYYWENYVLLGDPSLSPYIGTPEVITATVPDTIPPSLKSLNIETLPFAYAGLSAADSLWDGGHASSSGSLSFDLPQTAKDSCLLVISRQNGIPLIKTIYFKESDTAWISINDVNVQDAEANNNGQADYNETVSLDIELQNAGNTAADNVYMKLSSASEYIGIISDSLNIGSVTANSESIETGFEILVADSIPDLALAALDIDLYYNGNISSHTIDISLHAPEPVILNCVINDILEGNGNGLAEAGERVKVVIRVLNQGSSSVTGSLIISNISAYLDFDATVLATGVLNPGVIKEIEVSAGISAGTPESTELSFDAELLCLPYSTNKTLSIIAGKTAEDFELQNFTTFPWDNNSDYPWLISDEGAHSNMYAARSGNIVANKESVLSIQLNIAEDDSLRFWFKVSSEASYDFFNFMLNNKLSLPDSALIIPLTGETETVDMIEESGETGWKEAVIPLKKGVHLLQWVYKKDGSVSLGDDAAWIDLVRFPELSFIQSVISLNKIKSPEQGKSYDSETLSVELCNLGRDTLSSLSMAYIVNESAAVHETFNTDFKPGDTLDISFSQTIDMSGEGTYNISVFVTQPDNYFREDTLIITIMSTDIGDIIRDDKRFIIAPNPVRDNIRILCYDHSDDNMLMIYNSSGIMIYQKHIEHIAAGQAITLYPGQLPKGSYILRIRTGLNDYIYRFLSL